MADAADPATAPPPVADVLILGPVVLRRHETSGVHGTGEHRRPRAQSQITPSSRLLRNLLGLLALYSEQQVSDAFLVACLWRERDAQQALAALRGAVHRLRRWLRQETADQIAVRRTSTGYALELGAGRTDAARFRQLLSAARSAHPASRAGLLTEALDLWRGAALGDIAGTVADEHLAEVIALERDRDAAVLSAARTWLDLGRPTRATHLLEPVTRARPLDEPTHAMLMAALAAAGRRAAARSVYEQLRARLRDERGVQPDPQVSTAFARVLAQGEEQTCAVPAAPAVLPAQLPALVSAFTGREEQLRELDRLAVRQDAAAPMVIAAVTGAGGTGKTALAVCWAHRVAARFPDGQLYADLRGFSPWAPKRPLHVLTGFLRALGLPDERIPEDENDAARLYRSVLAVRRVLVVLDDVGDPGQVRPLLPGSPGCTVVVTSRSRLDGLVAVDGARRLVLQALPTAAAVDLLAALVGPARVAAEPQAAADLARACGGLPLALRIAATHVIGPPERSLAQQAALLRADALGELTVAGDEHAAVRRSLDLSYRRLGPTRCRFFRLLGLSPCATFDTAAAAALSGLTVRESGRILRELAAVHLVLPYGTGRFRVYDLASVYARERAEREEGPEARESAVRRLMGWYLASAERAARVMYPFSPRLPDQPADPPASAVFADTKEAAEWFDSERENLLAIGERAAAQGPRHIAWRVANAVRLFLFSRRRTFDLERLTDLARSAAEADGDPTGLAVAELCRTVTYYAHRNDPSGALRCGLTAVARCEEAGWREGQAAALTNNAVLCFELGKLDLAVSTARRSLEFNPALEATVLNNLALWHSIRGQLGVSVGYFRTALEKYGHLQDEQTAMTMQNFAGVLCDRGDFPAAADWFARALAAARDLGNEDAVSGVLVDMATMACQQRQYARACGHLEVALDLAGRRKNQRRRAQARVGLGNARLGLGDLSAAVDEHQQGLRISQHIHNAALEARALTGLAVAHDRLGATTVALGHVRRALARTRECGFRLYEARALTVLATVLLHEEDVEEAARAARQSLGIHEETESRPGVMEASGVLGDCLARTQGPAAARPHWQRARRLAAELGVGPLPAPAPPVDRRPAR